MVIKRKPKNIYIIIVLFLICSQLIYMNVVLAEDYTLPTIKDGYYHIRCNQNGLYLDVDHGIPASGTNVLVWTGNRQSNQTWQIMGIDQGDHALRADIGGYYGLAVGGDGTQNGSNVQIYGSTTMPPSYYYIPSYARWKINYNNDGTISLASKCSSYTKYLDCYKGGMNPGTNVIQWSWKSGENQKWVIEDCNLTSSLWEYDLVDAGGHCDWGGETKYQSLFNRAVTTWNNYTGGVFRPDALGTIQDLWIMDDTVRTSAYATTDASLNRITFFTKKMDSLVSDTVREAVILHELGHALGLGHQEVLGTTMCAHDLVGYTSLSLDDKYSFDLASKRY